MGLRNFIKKKVQKIKSRGHGYDSDNEEGQGSLIDPTGLNQGPLETTTKDTAKIIQDAQEEARTLRMGEDPRTGQIDVESRLGPESVQERISRIKRGEMSQEEKEAFLKSALSTGNNPASRLPMKTSSKQDDSNTRASPFPKDSILRDMARGSKSNSASSDTPPPPPLMDSQSKKKKYLEMVTDPRRFNALSSSTGGVAKNDSENSEETSPQATKEEQPNLPQDLGARLGAAAMENEKRNAELRRKQAEAQALAEQQQREREKKMIEAQRQRQELLAAREADIIKRRRAQEQEQARKQQKSNEAEAARRAELMKAQDDYWARKLAEQKAAAAKSSAPKPEEPKAVEDEGTQDDNESDESQASQEEEEEEEEEEASDDIDSDPLPEETGPQRLNDVSTRVLDKESELKQRKAAQEDEQIARLRSLNSPLPARPQRAATKRPIRKAAFEPQVPVNAGVKTPAQTLGDVTNTIKNKAGAVSTPSENAGTPESNESPVPPKPARPQEASLNPFARFTGGNKPAPAPRPTPAPRPAPAPAAKAAPRPAPSPAPAPAPPKRKGPIRMELPLGDEEDEPTMTEGMTIGEIMKRQRAGGSGADQEKRSKQWGVDMSRFQD